MQAATSGLWNNPHKVFASLNRALPAPAWQQPPVLSQAQTPQPAPAPAPTPSTKNIPLGVYIAGGVLVAAIVGIVSLR